MNIKILRITHAFALITCMSYFTVSCGIDQSVSKTSFEIAENEYAGLTHHALDEAIEVCLEFETSDSELEALLTPMVISSIEKWLDPLRELSANVTQSINVACPGHAKLYFRSSFDREFVTQGAYPRIYLNPDNRRLPYVLLHELGHAFGLADTYIEGSTQCKEGQPTSVMCKSNSTFLQEDDIEGIRAIFRNTNPTPNNPENKFNVEPVPNVDNPDKWRVMVMKNNVIYRLPSLEEYIKLTNSAPPQLLNDLKLACEDDNPKALFEGMAKRMFLNDDIDLGHPNREVLSRISKALFDQLFGNQNPSHH